MKKLLSLKALSLLIVLAQLPLFAFAGGSAGGGGGGIVCEIQGQTHVLLYDIYDRSPIWKKKLQLNLIKSNETAQVQLERAIKRIENEFMRELVKEVLNKIIANLDWLEADQEYKAGTDFGTQEAPVVPHGCDFRPIGYYFGAGFLAIDQNLYKAMSETSKAAFFMHEALYYIARQKSYHLDSTEVRRVVAGLFSQEKPEFELQKRIINLFHLGSFAMDSLVVINSNDHPLKIDVSYFPLPRNKFSTQIAKCNSQMFIEDPQVSFSWQDETVDLDPNTFTGAKNLSGKCRELQFEYAHPMHDLKVKLSTENVQRTFVTGKEQQNYSISFFLVTRQPTPRLPLN